MMPIASLMIEHRQIEKKIALLKKEKQIPIILEVIDYFRNYVDKIHHAKEEQILFKALKKKQLSKEHQTILNELIEEHKIGRKMIKEISTTITINNTPKINNLVQSLIVLYTAHIAKEDKQFFIPVMDYFNGKEQQEMLEKMLKFVV